MSRLPDKQQILDWISENPTKTSKRDISRAFGIKGAARIDLKRMLRELETEGHLEKRKRTYREAGELPPVLVARVLGPDADGDLLLGPANWDGEGPAPKLLFIPKKSDPALGEGDRALVKLTRIEGDYPYQARLIRRIAGGPRKILGIFRKAAEGGRIVPIEKGADREWRVPPGAMEGARDGELVEAEQTGPKSRLGLPLARITARLGDPGGPKAISLIAIHQHAIPDSFPPEALAEAEAARPAPQDEREDLRMLPLITIDPSDARDHDDACCAAPDDDPENPGGHILWVAIADVAHYVTPGSALDREARNRGNSTYFPDRVVPMLPEALSGDLCSLHEGVERPCLAVRMVLDAQGNKLSHRFSRAMMRSPAALSYAQVQAARDGAPDAQTQPLLEPVITPLYAAYEALRQARARRQPLDLDLPERQIVLDEAGRVTSVAFRARLDAHRLIEEFMVLANVAAAEELQARKSPLLFRVHEEPAPEKLEALREIVGASGLTLAKGQVLQTRHLNRLLEQAAGTDQADLINISTLRAMTQAYYAPENFGHFGLALRSYAHFTSPIRRYADLLVHRALIAAHGWGSDGLAETEIAALGDTATHISETERRSMVAERDTVDRYLAAYLADRVGTEMTGTIAGVARFGLFVKLDDSGADGLVPASAIGAEYFRFERERNIMVGADSGIEIGIGQRVLVRLSEVTPVTGGIALELLELEGAALGRPRRGARHRPPRRRQGAARQRNRTLKKKAARKR